MAFKSILTSAATVALLCAPAFAAPGQYPGGAGFTSSSYRAGSYTVTVTKGNVKNPNGGGTTNPNLRFDKRWDGNFTRSQRAELQMDAIRTSGDD